MNDPRECIPEDRRPHSDPSTWTVKKCVCFGVGRRELLLFFLQASDLSEEDILIQYRQTLVWMGLFRYIGYVFKNPLNTGFGEAILVWSALPLALGGAMAFIRLLPEELPLPVFVVALAAGLSSAILLIPGLILQYLFRWLTKPRY